MHYTICDYHSAQREALHTLYLASRQQAFTWAKPGELDRTDFDVVTKDEPILVAVHQHRPVGFVSWWPPENFIHNLFVDPAYFNRGIGTSLLTHCLARIGRPAHLKCLIKNSAAIAFYQSQKWVIETQGTSPEGDYYLMALPA